MKTERTSYWGFTLIELLVVIAIIGLLSTLAIVALGTARQKSRDSRRLADLKQIQTAFEMYANENDGMYPVTSSILLGDQAHACLTSSGFQSDGSCGSAYISFPNDPSGGFYSYTGTATDYTVGGILEGTVNELSGVIGISANGGIRSSAIGWWKFDEGGTSQPVDSITRVASVWMGNAAGTNGYYSPGKTHNWAGYFDGSTNYVTATVRNTGVITVSGWTKKTRTTSTIFDQPVAMKANDSYLTTGNDAYTLTWGYGDDFYWRIRTSDGLPGTTCYVNINPISVNTWHFVVGTFDGNEIVLYVDGSLVSHSNVCTGKSINSSSVPLYLGSRPGYMAQQLINDVKIYDRALSASEVEALYNSQR